MRSVLGSLVLVAGLILSSPGAAYADADPPGKAQAEALLKEGIALHEANKEEEALKRYQQAHDAYPTANILFAIASSEDALGRSVEAIRHYREAMKDRKKLHPKNEERGRDYIRELEAKLGRIEVKAPPGTTLTIDGARYDASLTEPIDLGPGEHRLTAVLGDRRKELAITCSAGNLTPVSVAFDEGSKIPVVEPPAETPRSSLFSTRNVVGASTAVVGLAAAAVGIGFLIDSNAKADEAGSIVDGAPGACDQRNPTCAQYRDDLFDSSQSSRTMSYVGFIGAGVFVAATVAIFAFWHPPSDRRGGLRATSARSFIGLGADF